MSAMPAIPYPEETPSPKTYPAKAVAAHSQTSGMSAITIPRRTPQPKDVQIEILYCGICHTDLHFVRNEFAAILPTVYPCVPGHEIVGRVVKAGAAVSKFNEGDLVGVGCMVDSDRTCDACRKGEEQFCASQPIFTYNAPDKHLGGVTYGGYDWMGRATNGAVEANQWQQQMLFTVGFFRRASDCSRFSGGIAAAIADQRLVRDLGATRFALHGVSGFRYQESGIRNQGRVGDQDKLIPGPALNRDT